ncbi:MAG: DUF885 domain-containing protein [Gammaproteobacteria bacterium]|nr:DUF885 domain-containing protein [Gammaproteobacteria bacterium]
MFKPKALILALAASLSLPVLAAEPPAWVAKSNALAQPVLESLVRFTPEGGTQLGLDAFDEGVADLKPGIYERSQADAQKELKALRAKLKAEKDAKVRQDLEIMAQAVANTIESARLNHELMLSYYDTPQNVFQGLQGLLDPRNPPERQKKAITRLKRYAGLEAGYEPITELSKARTAEGFANKKLVGPYGEEVTKAMDNTERYIDGIAEMFKAAKLSGWEEAHGKLAIQLRDYNAWVKKEVLPRARPTNRLPEAIYADNLKQFGVDMDPQELMRRASFGFIEIRDEMQAIAQRIAADEKLPSGDYREVLKELKKKQLVGDAILPFYKGKLKSLEALIVEHDILTLPKREASIRLASEAESAAQPAPHMNPPRLIGNQGEFGEFVLPLNNPNAKAGVHQDDFTNESFAWTLTAHEARPGHELQFAAMVENGVSIPRAVFAFNSANVEGWALYTEAVMKQYMPLDGQLFSLQARLQRAARAFLDPMLNLGLMKPDQAKAFLMKEVGLSEPFATQEVDRYTFKAPGQATSYYFGYLNIRELRARTELALGDKFNQKAFHDFILAQGLLPPEVLAKAVNAEFVPKYR